jgi:HlyD family secretion protein
VSFVFADRPDVLRVPNAALRFRPPADLLERSRRGSGEGESGGASGGRGAAGDAEVRRGGGQAGAGTPREPDRRTVWVMRGPDQAPSPVRIRTGVSDGSLTEVVEGELRDGDAVVTDASGGASGRPQGGPPGGMRRIL